MPIFSAAETNIVTTLWTRHLLCIEALRSHTCTTAYFRTPSYHWISLEKLLLFEHLQFLKYLRIWLPKQRLYHLLVQFLSAQVIETCDLIKLTPLNQILYLPLTALKTAPILTTVILNSHLVSHSPSSWLYLIGVADWAGIILHWLLITSVRATVHVTYHDLVFAGCLRHLLLQFQMGTLSSA